MPLIAAGLVACSSGELATEASCVAPPSSAYELCVIGDRTKMLSEGDLSASVRLSAVPDGPGSVAVGPVAGLRGEVTMVDGALFVSTMEAGAQVVAAPDPEDVGAVFLAYGRADAWQRVEIPQRAEGLDGIEALVRDAAEAGGVPTGPGEGFPFVIEGRAERLGYHVIFAGGHGGSHDHAAHKRAKVPFEANGREVRIAGVFVPKEAVGRVTHPGRRTHLHVIVGEAEGAGHVDAVAMAPGAVLYLPRADGLGAE